MIHLYYSNRQEVLFELLQERMLQKQPIESFQFNQKIVLAQNVGMQRWLTLQMAQHKGISAGIEFDFPLGFLWRLFKKVCDFPDDELIASRKEYTQIRLFEILQNHQNNEIINRFLQTETLSNKQRKLWDLSANLASLFDEYELFRTQKLQDKIAEAANKGDWQFQLFDELIKTKGDLLFRYESQLQLLEKLRTSSVAVDFKELHVYTSPTLPEATLRTLLLLSKQPNVTVYWYHLQPSQFKDWSELDKSKHTSSTSLPDFIETISLEGREQTSWIRRIIHEEDLEANYHETFIAEQPKTMLESYQKAILTNSPQPIEFQDDSIIIHSNYSPQREVEVLRDELIKLFELNNDIKPGDVLVMSSNIDTYAPYIEYYFNESDDESLTIPFSIADTKFSMESEQLQALEQLFVLLQSTLSKKEWLEFLRREPVKTKLNIDDSGISKIDSWLNKTHTVQGWEKEVETPVWGDFSLEKTREVLFKSLFFYPNEEQLVDNVLISFALVTQEDIELWSRFESATEKLYSYYHASKQTKPISEWLHFTLEVVCAFIDEGEYSALTSTLTDLSNVVQKANPEQHISLDLFVRFIQLHINHSSAGSGFLQGKVTCCAMVPLRSLPFKVICLLGLNEGQFPGKKIRSSFDWIEQEPQPGDRDRKKDDEYLFLESIVSTRKQLILSYVGRSNKDDTEYPKSALVSQFIDSVKSLTNQSPKLIEHPLYAFNPRNYESGTINYNKQAFSILHHAKESFQTKSANSIQIDVVRPTEDWKLDEWLRFIEHPIKYILNKEMSVRPYKLLEEERERELYKRNGLENWQFKDVLFNKLLETPGSSFEYLKLWMREKGLLEAGYDTEFQFKNDYEKITDRIEKLKVTCWGNEIPPEVILDFRTSNVYLQGALRYDYSSKVVFNTFSKISKIKHFLKAYLTGLFVAKSQQKEIQLIIFDKDSLFNPVQCEPNNAFFDAMIELTRKHISQIPWFQATLSDSYIKAVDKGDADSTSILDYVNEYESTLNLSDRISLQLFGKGTDWELTENWEPWAKILQQIHAKMPKEWGKS